MRGKSLALLILALGCGLVASLGITQVLKKGDAPPADTAPVYVAKVDIATGVLITDENTKTEQWPKDRVPAGTIAREEDLAGRRARQKIFAGEPLIEPKLLARGQVPTDSLVPVGYRVVPVPVSSEAIHSGLVLPGSRCDVQVYIPANQGGGGEPLCKTILQDIRVFAVNDVTSTESLDPKTPDTRSIPTGKTVSLLVTPAQAQIVTLASQLGTIRLIMRSGEDKDQPKTAAMTAHELLGAYGGADRAKENAAAGGEKRFLEWAQQMRNMLREEAKAASAKSGPAESSQRFLMRVRAGAEVSDILLINNSGVQGSSSDEGAWTPMGTSPTLHSKPSGDAHGAKPAEVSPAALPAGPTVPNKTDGPPPPRPADPRTVTS